MPHPDLPTHFRPIVLISLLYRLWASASAKSFLPRIHQVLSPHVFGYVPDRRATDLWAMLQPLSGYCAGLVKCFNRLPRKPLIKLLQHFGLSDGVATAWLNALDSLQRRFRIFHDVGPPHLSATGFPEGDPLSILAMLAFNAVFDKYIKVFAPDCVPLAFVDNIQLVSTLAAQLQPGILVLRTFLDAWDLDMDEDKSYAWSTHTKQRSSLKALGHCVRLACRDLGAQMHYFQKPSKAVFKQRLASVGHVWVLLRRSLAKPWFRRQAIRVAIWPKLFHACASDWICEASLDSLRAKCMYALKWDRSGASPIVRWGLAQPLGFDPSFAQVWMVLSTWWRLSHVFEFVWNAWASLSELSLPRTGIFHAVSAALTLLGWTLGADWALRTPWFDVRWHDLALEELRLLVGHFWQQQMIQRVRRRKDFAGLDSLDVYISLRSFKPKDIATAELVATIQDGTFCANNIIHKFDPDKPDLCSLCGQTDDLQHRCLVCPKYEEVRSQHVHAVRQWPLHSRAFTDHALVPLNPFQQARWGALIGMPDQSENFYLHPCGDGPQHLFTDGACLSPTVEPLRLAAWAVISMKDNMIVADGLVPGLIQTIDLAELYAAYAALKWALRHSVEIVLHVDSSYVVNGLSCLRTSQSVPKHWRNQKLWGSVNEVLQQLLSGQWHVHKVFSHGDPTFANTVLDEWMIAGNRKADRAAGLVFDRCPSDFWNNYVSLSQYHFRQSQLVQSQLNFLLDIARCSFDQSTQPLDVEDVTLSTLVLPWSHNTCDLAAQLSWDSISELNVQQMGGFSVQFCESAFQFLYALDLEAPQARFVTGLELLCAFLTFFEGSVPHPKIVNGVVK